MHPEAIHFTTFVKSQFTDYFKDKKVIDIGGSDVNGNNRFLFENCDYSANDVVYAPNVTIVSKTKDLPFPDNTFDVIISTECFEHDSEYTQSFTKIYQMLKPSGLFCFTCASIGRPEHGTRRTTPAVSYGTLGMLKDMQDYYKNLTIEDVNQVLNLNSSFVLWRSYYNSSTKDLYFYGIKNGEALENIPIEYSASSVVSTTFK